MSVFVSKSLISPFFLSLIVAIYLSVIHKIRREITWQLRKTSWEGKNKKNEASKEKLLLDYKPAVFFFQMSHQFWANMFSSWFDLDMPHYVFISVISISIFFSVQFSSD